MKKLIVLLSILSLASILNATDIRCGNSFTTLKTINGTATDFTVLDDLKVNGIFDLNNKLDMDYTDQTNTVDGTRYNDFTVTSSSSPALNAEVSGIYGAYNWTMGDNQTFVGNAIEGVARSQGADESATLRGVLGRFYIDPTSASNTLRTGVGVEASARASYSGGTAITAENGTAFVGSRIWLAPYFTAVSTANINNFHGLWVYNEHPTISVTNAIYINNAASGGFDYGLNMNSANINAADIKLHNGATIDENTDGKVTISEKVSVPKLILNTAYEVGVATPSEVGELMRNAAFELYIGSGTTDCYQWIKVGQQ